LPSETTGCQNKYDKYNNIFGFMSIETCGLLYLSYISVAWTCSYWKAWTGSSSEFWIDKNDKSEKNVGSIF
jgi:hypothetical protein